MEKLYLMRHAKAVPNGTPGVTEYDRPLTDEGEEQAYAVGKGLRRLEIGIDCIYCSPQPRAAKTAKLVCQAMGQDPDTFIEEVDVLALDSTADAVQAWLKTVDEPRILVVGHHPWISNLVALLTSGTTTGVLNQMGRAAVAALDPDSDGQYLFRWYMPSKILRRIKK